MRIRPSSAGVAVPVVTRPAVRNAPNEAAVTGLEGAGWRRTARCAR